MDYAVPSCISCEELLTNGWQIFQECNFQTVIECIGKHDTSVGRCHNKATTAATQPLRVWNVLLIFGLPGKGWIISTGSGWGVEEILLIQFHFGCCFTVDCCVFFSDFFDHVRNQCLVTFPAFHDRTLLSQFPQSLDTTMFVCAFQVWYT